MKKFLAVLFAVLAIFTMSSTAFAAEAPVAVTIDGYTVTTDETVKVIYIDLNGEVTEVAEDAVQVVLKAAGDLIVNGKTFAAGANGRVNVQLDLPMTAPAEESAEETANNSLFPAKRYAPAEEKGAEVPVSDEEILVGAEDAPVVVSFWRNIWTFICSIFSFLF